MVVRVSGRVGAFEVLVREETGGKFRFKRKAPFSDPIMRCHAPPKPSKPGGKLLLQKPFIFRNFLRFRNLTDASTHANPQPSGGAKGVRQSPSFPDRKPRHARYE